MFTYCLNNPIVFSDPLGNLCGKSFNYETLETGRKLLIMYDVPLYNQKRYKLCWAFCQIMIEDYEAGVVSTQEEATEKAISLAKSVNGVMLNKIGDAIGHGIETWNRGGFPTNSGDPIFISDIYDLYLVLQEGPAYGYYRPIQDGLTAHMVVITGVDVSAGLVYTNNPWNLAGVQTFREFVLGYYGYNPNNNPEKPLIPLRYVYSVS